MAVLLLPILVTCISFWLQFGTSYGFVTMFAPINAIGLTGNITFRQESSESITNVAVYLSPVIPRDNSVDYNWKIMSNPYYLGTPCSEESLGRVEHDMTPRHGPIQVPSTNLGGGQSFNDPDLSLYGRKTIWSSSLVIQQAGGPIGCTNILLEGKPTTAQAQFLGPTFSGTILLRENANKETIILSQLTYTGDEFRTNSKHDWKILVSDSLDFRPNTENKCHYLETILDYDNLPDDQCSETEHANCKVGDLTKKHGQITIYSDNGRGTKQKFIDSNLPLAVFESTRSSYFVIYDRNDPNRALSCGLIVPVIPKKVTAVFDMDGVKGNITFSQDFITDPTTVTVRLQNLQGRGDFYKIHQFPISPMLVPGEKICGENVTGVVYNPLNNRGNREPGQGTNDQYPVGDLSGKYGRLTSQDIEIQDFFSSHLDLNLPLFGRHSIIGRSVVIHKTDGEPWICASIGYPGPVTTAVATFYFPIAGQIIFRQESASPSTDTTVFVELAYSGEKFEDTTNHAFHVHIDPPGADWYNWTARCASTKGHFNPTQVGLAKYTTCNPNNPYRCELGDLASKAGEKISIAGHKGSKLVKLFYTDPVLPLFGLFSIIGRSIVVHDENGPVQRGNRLACTLIKQVHQLTAASREWSCSNGLTTVSGSIVFTQDTQYDPTFVQIGLSGLSKHAGGFHVHEVSVPIDSPFPCDAEQTYGHFDPLLIGSNLTHLPGVGSSDQYEIGDISGKTGTLAGLDEHQLSYYDHNLPLFGPNSIVGRSMVIHEQERPVKRWVCGSIKAEVRNNEGREIIALASFHDPKHLVKGYVRFRQYEYSDGSTSNTWIDVDLSHGGKFNFNVTSGHRWKVFVSQVGADAFHNLESVRCVAGSGIWNPLFVDGREAAPSLYRQDCSKTNPFRCQLGDLTGKNGHLVLGKYKRRLFTDVNLPLVGPNSIVGRSLIIFNKDDSEHIMACTNILPDTHYELTISVVKTPTFTVPAFMRKMKDELRTTDWLVVADYRSYATILDEECITLHVHFYGKFANRLQDSFRKLISFGTTQHQDEDGSVRQLNTPYKPCNPILESISGSRKISLSGLTFLAATIGYAFLL